jgi:hypothetical protein
VLNEIDVNSMRSVRGDKIVMLTPGDRRQDICAHLDGVEVLDVVKLGSWPVEQDRV